MKVFLSHAKLDGTNVAKAVRDYIYQKTQLSAFFDENDIALGFKFAVVLNRSLITDTVAMISVNSDYYSSRPWCRREIQIFSQPRKNDGDIWEKAPVLVVQSMNGGLVANAIPEFGNTPVIRWRDGDEALCIDTLLREIIFRSYHSLVAALIRDVLKSEGPEQNRLFVNWAPDSEDLLAYGFGREHLREFLVRLARRLLRAGANLGLWRTPQEGFIHPRPDHRDQRGTT